MKKLTLTLLLAVLLSTAAQAQVALIYKGEGSCRTEDGDAGKSGYGCSEASAVLARLAGFIPKYVSGTELNDDSSPAEVKALFHDARLWIQPGGHAVEAYRNLSPRMKKELKHFISEGGGFVGFCAGAYMATKEIGTSGIAGLGILPGITTDYDYKAIRGQTYTFEPIRWKETRQGRKTKIITRQMYFEGGPAMKNVGPTVETIGTYRNGELAAVRSNYFKGKVFVAGPHPEAPSIWSLEDHIRDPDGSEVIITVRMLRWAAAAEPVDLHLASKAKRKH